MICTQPLSHSSRPKVPLFKEPLLRYQEGMFYASTESAPHKPVKSTVKGRSFSVIYQLARAAYDADLSPELQEESLQANLELLEKIQYISNLIKMFNL